MRVSKLILNFQYHIRAVVCNSGCRKESTLTVSGHKCRLCLSLRLWRTLLVCTVTRQLSWDTHCSLVRTSWLVSSSTYRIVLLNHHLSKKGRVVSGMVSTRQTRKGPDASHSLLKQHLERGVWLMVSKGRQSERKHLSDHCPEHISRLAFLPLRSLCLVS